MVDRYYPMPEAIEDAPYRITEGAPSITEGKALTVPLGGEPWEVSARALQLARLKWGLVDIPGTKADKGTKEIILDHRAKVLMYSHDMGQVLKPGTVPETALTWKYKGALDNNDFNEIVKGYLAAAGTGYAAMAEKSLTETLRRTAAAGKPNLQLRYLKRTVLPKVTQLSNEGRLSEAATYLQEFLERTGEPGKGMKNAEEQEAAQQQALREMESALKEAETEESKEDLKKIAEALKDPEKWEKGTPGDNGRGVGWGAMKILTPERKFDIPGYIANRNTASEMGVVFRNPHRWVTDQRVFTRKRLMKGGSVLIDGSGSMGNSEECAKMCQAIVTAAPGCTIAVYGGSGRFGSLRILAAKGKIVDTSQMKSPGGSNIVDLPALEWLAKQEAPRYWVSDGHARGVDDMGSTETTEHECKLFAARKGITRVESWDKAVEVFQKKSKWE